MRISDWSSDVCSSDLIGLDLLDADGKHILLTSLMQAQRWDDAYAGAQTLTEDDFEDAPAARQAVAMALITHNVPADLRGVVASVTPLDAASFPLFDRSEERRAGKECVSTCRSRWAAYH